LTFLSLSSFSHCWEKKDVKLWDVCYRIFLCKFMDFSLYEIYGSIKGIFLSAMHNPAKTSQNQTLIFLYYGKLSERKFFMFMLFSLNFCGVHGKWHITHFSAMLLSRDISILRAFQRGHFVEYFSRALGELKWSPNGLF
jgi:hypothetical protein